MWENGTKIQCGGMGEKYNGRGIRGRRNDKKNTMGGRERRESEWKKENKKSNNNTNNDNKNTARAIYLRQ